MGIHKGALRAVAFLAVFLLLFFSLQQLVTPSYNWPESFDRLSDSVRGIFMEPENSLQVIWLGTSHVRNGVSPMRIYGETGIRSYNLATAAQTTALGWSWLKLVMKRQSPQVVLMDVSSCFYPKHYSESSASEVAWRKVIDSLGWSRIAEKFDMSTDMLELSDWGGDDFIASMLPLLRYHTNCMLEEADYARDDAERIALLKGYCQMDYRREKGEGEDEEAFSDDLDSQDLLELEAVKSAALRDNLAYNRQFVERIQRMCVERGCELILIKVPLNADAEMTKSYWSDGKHDLIAAMAAELGCRFVDMNYEDVGLDWSLDTSDGGIHLNSSGARKVSAFLAGWLAENTAIESVDAGPEDTWDAQLALYDREDRYYGLIMEDRLSDYLKRLDGGDYTVFMTVSGKLGKYWTQKRQDALVRSTGAAYDLFSNYASGGKATYALVSCGGEVLYERAHKSKCAAEGTLPDGTAYSVVSRKKSGAAEAEITIDGVRFTNSASGVWFVVYANDLHCVVDNVRFDTTKKGAPFTRRLKNIRSKFRRALADFEVEGLSEL